MAPGLGAPEVVVRRTSIIGFMSSATSAVTGRVAAPGDRRWLVLIVVAIAQLMVVLDSTIVNIALPSAQRTLGFPNTDRQWVVTAYALAFGCQLKTTPERWISALKIDPHPVRRHVQAARPSRRSSPAVSHLCPTLTGRILLSDHRPRLAATDPQRGNCSRNPRAVPAPAPDQVPARSSSSQLPNTRLIASIRSSLTPYVANSRSGMRAGIQRL